MPPTKRRRPVHSSEAPNAIHPFDLEHGVETSGLIPASALLTGHPNDRHVTAYYGIAPSILRKLIDRWLGSSPSHFIEHVSFIDIGAGKGRAILIASQYPFHAIYGIEINPTLAAIAQRNLSHWIKTQPHLAEPTITVGDALEFAYPPTPCLVCLFHPFEAPLLRKLLRCLEAQFADRPGTLDLLYINSEHAAVIDPHPAFTRLFLGKVAMSAADHVADLAAIAQQAEYGSSGDEECAIYRFTGRASKR